MTKIKCNLCNREYSSKYSLSNHKRIKHKNINTHNINNFNTDNGIYNRVKNVKMSHYGAVMEPVNILIFNCEYCNNEYKHRQSLNRHYKKCLKKKEYEEKKKKNDEENERILKEMYRMSKELEEYKKKTRRLERENKKNIRKQQIINNSNNNNTNNINNGTVNNINIYSLGNEDIPNKFSDEIQQMILSKMENALVYLINYVHFNPEFPEFHNIKLKNMRSSIGYKYNDNNKEFEAVPKKDLIEKVKFERMNDIENFAEYNIESLKPQIANCVNKFIDNMCQSKFSKSMNNDVECALYNGSKKIFNS